MTHTHDCTGPDQRCACGFVFRVPRYCVSLSVYDNDTKAELMEDAFMTDSIDTVRDGLKRAVYRLASPLKAQG